MNVLLGEYDSKAKDSSFYWLDYMGILQKVNFGVQGHASNFCLSIMDREWKSSMTKDKAIVVIKKCIKELQIPFLSNQNNFMIKVVDENGIEFVREDGDSKDN